LNIVIAVSLVVGLCLLFAAPYIVAWSIYRKNEKMLRAHASEASGLGMNTQEVFRRLLEREGLEKLTVYQSLKKHSYFDLARSSIYLAPRLYGKDTISAISETSTLFGRIYCLTHPTWAHKIGHKVLSYVLLAALSLSLLIFIERHRLTEEAQVVIVFLLLTLLAFWCSVSLRQLWLESSYGFERLKRILSSAEFNGKLYKGFIFKPYRKGIAWAISLLWSAIVLMP
jgi:Zn-dependent membrane protease YugP